MQLTPLTLASVLFLSMPTWASAQATNANCTAAWLRSPAAATCTGTSTMASPSTCQLNTQCPDDSGTTLQDNTEVLLRDLHLAKNCNGSIHFRQPCRTR